VHQKKPVQNHTSCLMHAAAVGFAAILIGCGSPALEVTETADGFRRVETIGMTLQWRVQGDTAEFIVTSPEQGWVGVGFDPVTTMRGADIIIGYVESDGTVVIEDHYGHQLTAHRPDTDLGGTDDVEVIGGERTGDGTKLHFRRPLDSGDEYDNPLVPGGTHKIMLAYGRTRDFSSDHGRNARTSFEVEF
jgi:hypothetical protein